MMERALKERIIGAVVLVIFVVLVVPVFLDGPPGPGEFVTERIVLPGQEGQDITTVILDRERSVPVPAATSDKEEPKIRKAPQVARLQPEPVATQPEPVAAQPEPVATQAAASTTGMWTVQLGSFSKKQNAENLIASLKEQGFSAFLSQIGEGSGQLHRVRIGPQKDRASAETMAARLVKVGHKGQVVPHP